MVVSATACSGSSDGAKADTSTTKAEVPSRGNVNGALALGQLAPLTAAGLTNRNAARKIAMTR